MEGKKQVVKKETVKESGKLAILELGGAQHLIREGTELTVPHLSGVEKSKVKTPVTILQPSIGKGTATYRVVEHLKGPKIVVMKYKAKSRYRKKQGFRAQLSKIVVEKIEV
jgi:large subunit ribosomal protein L21